MPKKKIFSRKQYQARILERQLIRLEELIMKSIVWIFNAIVQITLMTVLLFDRKTYLHCIDLDGA
ncbi:MAG: hypothetical protein M0Q44_12025 [Methylobacter sp.]|nr:hypothetical protein [Methylobacter sp.]